MFARPLIDGGLLEAPGHARAVVHAPGVLDLVLPHAAVHDVDVAVRQRVLGLGLGPGGCSGRTAGKSGVEHSFSGKKN